MCQLIKTNNNCSGDGIISDNGISSGDSSGISNGISDCDGSSSIGMMVLPLKYIPI